MDILVDIRWHLVMLDPYCSVGAGTLTDMRGRIRMRVDFQSEEGDIGQHDPAERWGRVSLRERCERGSWRLA
jgi:hypothetical protein